MLHAKKQSEQIFYIPIGKARVFGNPVGDFSSPVQKFAPFIHGRGAALTDTDYKK